MTHSCVWHDSFMCVTWLIHVCDMTHSCVWHDSSMCVPWRMRLVSYLTCFVYVTWTTAHIHKTCHTHTCMWHGPQHTNRRHVIHIHVCDLDHITTTPQHHNTTAVNVWLLHVCGLGVWLLHVCGCGATPPPHMYVVWVCGCCMYVVVVWLLRVCDGFMCVTWLNHVDDLTHSYVWHDSFVILGLTHLCAWHDAFKCVAWLIHMCVVTHCYVCRDLLICVPWLAHMCRYSLTCLLWLIVMCPVTHSYVSRDSLIRVPWP